MNYFDSLSDAQKRKVLLFFKHIGDFGKISNVTKFRNEGDKVFAFKPQPDRFLSFFYKGKKIIITSGFRKKSQKLPKREKEAAIKIMRDYEQRVKSGEYYG